VGVVKGAAAEVRVAWLAGRSLNGDLGAICRCLRVDFLVWNCYFGGKRRKPMAAATP
jgi:hypothetical protein